MLDTIALLRLSDKVNSYPDYMRLFFTDKEGD